MLPLIIPPDVDRMLLDALNAGYAAAGENPHVGTMRPNPLRDEFVVVRRAGGPRVTLITEDARVLLEGWALTEARASRLLNIGRAVLFAQNGDLFGADEYAGPANFPDPTIPDRARYTAGLSIQVRYPAALPV